jgi:hypothetical protein
MKTEFKALPYSKNCLSIYMASYATQFGLFRHGDIRLYHDFSNYD